ncbi:hypothetical protein GQ44DRAFT_790048 [Phaeosphaeriaceae sp. PMI808]|nr:hypothetical protein GQ44DRAFT_790048 [Phaeosphaeriaceae sp. PMI808]
MAFNGHAPPVSEQFDRQTQASSRPSWHEKHGSEEFKEWQAENPTQHISYEDWKSSKHVDGLSLYYAALRIWEESDSSEADVGQLQVETRLRGVRAQSAREPKKTLKANGNGLSHSMGTLTPSAIAHSEDLSISSKKKRKARKKYLSEELVASEESEDGETATPVTGKIMPSAPVIAANGRRKSSNRRPRKKPISEEIISPEDEENDPMATSGMTTPAIASPLPVRSAPKSSATVPTSGIPKKTILKLSTRKAPRKKILSEEIVRDDDTDEGNTATISSTTPKIAPNVTTTIESYTASTANTVTDSNDAPDSPGATSESAAAKRRGLRTRRPAQQRPYSLDAQTYEEHDTDVQGEENIQPSPGVLSRRASVVSSGKEYTADRSETLYEESLAILHGGVDPNPEESHNRPKHFKGKGRAWKKEESDEDLEFNPGKKKSAKAKAKMKTPQQPKKRGRPRKSVLSEDVVRDDSDDEAVVRMEDASPSPTVPEETAEKAQKLHQKSVLSEEIVRDDTDEDVVKEEGDQTAIGAILAEVSTSVPKKRGRPRKSDQASVTGTVSETNEGIEETMSYTSLGTPIKYTDQSELEQSKLSQQNPVPVDESINEVPSLESDSRPVAASQFGTEAPVASTNVQTDEGPCLMAVVSLALLKGVHLFKAPDSVISLMYMHTVMT